MEKIENKKENVSEENRNDIKGVFVVDLYNSSSASGDQSLACNLSVLRLKGKRRQFDITFISLVCFPEINDSNWFEVEIPQPDAAVSAPGGKALFADIHAENPWLEEMTGCQWGSAQQMSNDRTSPSCRPHSAAAAQPGICLTRISQLQTCYCGLKITPNKVTREVSYFLLKSSTDGLLWLKVSVYTRRNLVKPPVRHLVVQKARINMYCSYYPLPHPPIPSPSCWSNRYHLILWSKRLILFYWAESNDASMHGFDPSSVY